jgi:pilus assembly protein CpaF
MGIADRLRSFDDLNLTIAAPESHANENVRRVEPRDWAETKRRVRLLIIEELAPRVHGMSSDERIREVRDAIDRAIQREDVVVAPTTRAAFAQEVLADIVGHGPLDRLLEDDSITEIMCNAFDEVWVERDGVLEATDAVFADERQYRQVIERMTSRVGRRIDESSPMVDARLPDGSRINAVIPPLALRGPALTIRKFGRDVFTAADLLARSNWNSTVVEVMEAAVRGKTNVLVAGGTGTGKTTALSVLASFIPRRERIVTIEDSAELRLDLPNIVSLEARPSNSEGSGEVTIRDLVRNALRMRPDRVVVGECRGGEALDMLQAMNTGHQGSLTTIHSNTPRDALSRLETLVLMAGYDLPLRAIREQIASGIGLVVQLERLPDGRRITRSICEVQGIEADRIQLLEIFKAVGDGELRATGFRPELVERLSSLGIELPPALFRPPIDGSTL